MNNPSRVPTRPYRRPAPTINKRGDFPKQPTRTALSAWETTLGVVIVLIAVASVVWFFILGPKLRYKPDFIQRSYIRNLAAPKPISPTEVEADLFSTSHEREYVDGKGVKVLLTTQEPGRSDFTEAKVVLEPFKKWNQEPAPERKREIEGAKGKLRDLIDKFNHPPAYIRIFVFVDNTDDDQELFTRVSQQYKAFVAMIAVQGSPIKVKLHRITGSPFYDESERMDVEEAAVQSRLQEISEAEGDPSQTKSAIASDLFHDLDEDTRGEPLDKQSRILLFTDLVENDPRTVSFEIGRMADVSTLERELGSPEKRGALKQRLQTVAVCPALHGAQVDVYLPANSRKLPKMLALFPLWQEILAEHGAASVNLHY